MLTLCSRKLTIQTPLAAGCWLLAAGCWLLAAIAVAIAVASPLQLLAYLRFDDSNVKQYNFTYWGLSPSTGAYPSTTHLRCEYSTLPVLR
eukprot:COSAG06_NODE_5190_length_3648_cov_3.167371_10_plen_89_part_01